MQNLIIRLSLILTLLLSAGSASVLGAELVMPQKQAAHFCRLLMDDGEAVCPLSIHAQRLAADKDSLTAEQLLTAFLFHKDNWNVLRIFPHKKSDGTVVWYAPADKLPDTINAEHQKYIREVFPRLKQQIEAGDWKTVDAYIDRMIEYQCKFGGSQLSSGPSPHLILIIASGLAVLLIAVLIMGRRKKTA